MRDLSYLDTWRTNGALVRLMLVCLPNVVVSWGGCNVEKQARQIITLNLRLPSVSPLSPDLTCAGK